MKKLGLIFLLTSISLFFLYRENADKIPKKKDFSVNNEFLLSIALNDHKKFEHFLRTNSQLVKGNFLIDNKNLNLVEVLTYFDRDQLMKIYLKYDQSKLTSLPLLAIDRCSMKTFRFIHDELKVLNVMSKNILNERMKKSSCSQMLSLLKKSGIDDYKDEKSPKVTKVEVSRIEEKKSPKFYVKKRNFKELKLEEDNLFRERRNSFQIDSSALAEFSD